MKNDILLKYRMLNAEEVNREIFKDFIRYQNVTKCWRKKNGKWISKDDPFVDDWTENDYQKLIFCNHTTLETEIITTHKICIILIYSLYNNYYIFIS